MSLLYHPGNFLILVVRLIHDFGGYETADAADRYLTRKVGPVGMLEFLATGIMAGSNRHAAVY
jgi:hypothetical protein